MAPQTAPVAVGNAAATTTPAAKSMNAAQNPVRRRIEPVIPLPYMRRPKAPTATSQLPASPSPLRHNDENAPPNSKHDPENQTHPELQPRPDRVEAVANGGRLADDAPGSPQKPEQDDAGVTIAQADDPPFKDSRPVTAGPPTQLTPTQSQTAGEATPPDTVPSVPSTASFPPPALSPPPPNMRNNFYPAANGQFRGPVPDPIRLPSHPLNPPRMHQHHPSNGSLVFGGFHGSNTSSPVPRSGGVFPPPMSMTHEQIPVTGVDSFGRPMVATAPIDTHAPVAMNHGPLTPHSFHGSQSSRNEDFNGKTLANGLNGVDVARTGPVPSAVRPPFHPNNQTPFSPDGFEVGEAVGFAEYVSSMFARAEFADCELVLVIPDRLTSVNSQYPGMSNGPLRLPAHLVVLSHHPMLRKMIHENAQSGGQPREVRIVSDDPFLRADAMWRAIKYLYGCRYAPMPHGLEKESDVERFHFTLGYAAAGARLEVPHISITAVREASKLIGWDTVEKGLEFALAGLEINPDRTHIPHTFPQFRYKHGVYVGELVEKIMMFLITRFPTNFTLDTTVEDPRYARLPALTFSSQDQIPPETINHNLHGGQAPPRATNINIKFGDLDPSEANGRVQNGPSQHPGGHSAALSRILLNLPFEMLKLVLESNGLGGVSGWQTVQDRRRVMADVLTERETRRLRFICGLAAGRYQGPVPMDGLRSKEPRLLDGTWSNVCWKEEYLSNADVPMMGRLWAPVGELS